MNISVYITSYNQRDYLIEAIESVLSQTLTPYQIIVIDDCSVDDSQDVIADYARRHPKLLTPVYHKHNTGIGQTRIDALQAVTGDYVTYLDGDDRYLPTKLEKEAAALRATPEAQIAFSNNRWIKPDGQLDRLWITDTPPPQGRVFMETFAKAYPHKSLFRCELVQYKAWQQIGFHDARLNVLEDWEMRIRLTQRCRTVYVDEPLSEYRLHGQGLSLSSPPERKKLRAIEMIIAKNQPLLKDLPLAQRQWVMNQLGVWIRPKLGQLIRDELVTSGTLADRWLALRMYVKCQRWNPTRIDFNLVARIFFPKWMVRSEHLK